MIIELTIVFIYMQMIQKSNLGIYSPTSQSVIAYQARSHPFFFGLK
jgi:hypothetical protein